MNNIQKEINKLGKVLMAQLPNIINFLRDYYYEFKKDYVCHSNMIYSLYGANYYAPDRVYVKTKDCCGNTQVLFELHSNQGLKKCSVSNRTLKNLCISLIDFREMLLTDINVSEDNKALLKELEDKGLV